jgi:Mu-like phage gp27
MGQKSAVDKLPEPLRKKLIELLNRPDVTQLEIVDAINTEAGEPLISKSSLNRYAVRMKKFAEKNRQAREVAEAYLEKYGSDTRNRLGKVVNEQVRLVAFDLISELEELKEAGKVDPKFITEVIFKVSRGLKELEHAEKLNAEREDAIRELILKETAAKVEAVGKKKGVSKEAMETILAEVFRIQ